MSGSSFLNNCWINILVISLSIFLQKNALGEMSMAFSGSLNQWPMNGRVYKVTFSMLRYYSICDVNVAICFRHCLIMCNSILVMLLPLLMLQSTFVTFGWYICIHTCMCIFLHACLCMHVCSCVLTRGVFAIINFL